MEWQQCYGSFGDEKVFSGVIQKSDRNWVIAGSADYNSDDVSCSLHGEYVEDYWIFEIKDTTTNIITNQINDIEIKAYPNPATDYVVFELNSQGLKYNKNEIKIKNIFGQEVERLQIKSGKTIWDTRHLPSGIYIYTIDNLEFSKPDKIMITK